MSLENALKDFLNKTDFVRFDTFFTGFMLGVPKDCYTEEERKQACSLFREKTDKREIASYPTIRKWFGLGGKTKPDRMQIFEIAFALSLSAQDVNLILKEGMFEPGIRINDYREIIFWFGLLNHLSYEECCVMIEQFERHINSDLVIVQATNTAELLYAFENNKQLSKDEFMDWLDSIAGVFKGYGKTALNYMLKLKKLVVSYMRKEWKILLENMLASTDFETWKKKKRNRHKLSEGEQIRQYLYKEKSLSDERRKEILDMVSFVYFEEDNNVRVLAEIFPDTRISLLRDTLLRGMTQKHLSDLLNIAKQKEKDMELTRKRYELLDSMEKNPEAVKQLSQIEKTNGSTKDAWFKLSVQIYFHSYSTLPYFVIWKKSVPAEKSMRQKKQKSNLSFLPTRFLPPVIWLLSQKNMSSIRCCYLAFKKMTAICTKNWQNNW